MHMCTFQKTVRIMESMKRVASKSAKRSVSNPEGGDDGEHQHENKEKPKPPMKPKSIKVREVKWERYRRVKKLAGNVHRAPLQQQNLSCSFYSNE